MFSQERVFDNVQISTTFRYVFLLVSLRQQVLLGGMFDITRISIHCHIWQCICKPSSSHEGYIASTSVHGCGGNASGGACGADADDVFCDITTFEIFCHGGVFDNVQIFSILRSAYLVANPGKLVPLGNYLPRLEFSSTFISVSLFRNQVLFVKSKSFRHLCMVMVLVLVVVLVV